MNKENRFIAHDNQLNIRIGKAFIDDPFPVPSEYFKEQKSNNSTMRRLLTSLNPDRFLSKPCRQAQPKAKRFGRMNFKVVDARGRFSLQAGCIVIFHVVDLYVKDI